MSSLHFIHSSACQTPDSSAKGWKHDQMYQDRESHSSAYRTPDSNTTSSLHFIDQRAEDPVECTDMIQLCVLCWIGCFGLDDPSPALLHVALMVLFCHFRWQWPQF